ncbi:hypothetical protein SMSKK35_2126 [Stenotrophomonas maltophilia SKK35]|nr:hypothetical protein SMSKK35_2126 [Stenotrophomonas maltophilia SKK35]
MLQRHDARLNKAVTVVAPALGIYDVKAGKGV